MSRHIKVTKTRTNGYEFATEELGIFTLSTEKQLENYMKVKKWTYEVKPGKSRIE